MVERFCTDNVDARQIDKDNQVPQLREMWRKLGALGLHGVTASVEYGGLGLGYFEHCLVMECLSKHSASLALSYGAHSNLCINQIERNGSPEQRARLLPKLISGDWIGSLAMSESNAGSDVVSMKLQAKAAPTGYALTGHKMWITNGPDCDVLFVYARTSQDEKPSRSLSAFVTETAGLKGFARSPKLDKLGMRGSNTCELVFDNCQLASDCLVGKVGDGARILMSGLDYERLILSAGPVGIMRRVLDLAIPYVQERRQFNEPLASFQLVQATIADMYTQWASSRALMYATARWLDRTKHDDSVDYRQRRMQCAASILLAAENATQSALKGIQLLGGNGYINDYDMGRLLRDAKLYEIGAGTSEIRRLIIGRELLMPKQQ